MRQVLYKTSEKLWGCEGRRGQGTAGADRSAGSVEAGSVQMLPAVGQPAEGCGETAIFTYVGKEREIMLAFDAW